MSLSSSPNRPVSKIAVWFHSLIQNHGRPGLALIGSLGALWIAAIVYLCEAESPWGKVVQKRLSKGQSLQFNEIVICSLWWAVLACTIVLLLLLLTHRWWLPKAGKPLPTFDNVSTKNARPFWWKLAVIASMGLCLWQSYPRLTQSLWNDEEYAMRRFAHGEWVNKGDGTLEFKPITWKETFFFNRNANNHLLDSVLTRISLETWRFATGQPRSAFNETAVRLPSLLASLGTLWLVALLGSRMGSPWVGAGSALLLSVIPWHVHYSSDGKGYAELMFFILLHVYGTLKALETNRIRWWLVFGLAEAAYLLCFPAAVYVAIITNALLWIELWRSKRFSDLPIWIAFNLIGAIPVILWAAPSVPQVVAYFSEGKTMKVSMNLVWLRDLFSALYLGFGYQNLLPEHHFGTSWKEFTASHHWLVHTAFATGLIPLLLLTGFFISLWRDITTRLIIAAPILAAVVSFAINAYKQSPMVVWHFVFVLPSLALAIGLALWRLLPARFAAGTLVLVIGIYSWSRTEAVQLKRQHDRQPIRQTAEWINQQGEKSLVATWGVSDNQSRSYLPKTKILKTLQDLTQMEEQARLQNLPLYVFFCGELTATASRNPDLTQHVRQSGQYRQVAEFKGLEELFTYRILQWQP